MEKTFYKNTKGVNIVKCCASCIHNTGLPYDMNINKSGGEMYRKCDIEGCVKLTDLCGEWRIKPCYENAGKGSGKIKKKHYLYYVLQRRQEEPNSLSISKIRCDYMEEFGNIYNTNI